MSGSDDLANSHGSSEALAEYILNKRCDEMLYSDGFSGWTVARQSYANYPHLWMLTWTRQLLTDIITHIKDTAKNLRASGWERRPTIGGNFPNS